MTDHRVAHRSVPGSIELGISELRRRLAEVHDGENSLLKSSLMRVPRPMICLNSVCDSMLRSRTMS